MEKKFIFNQDGVLMVKSCVFQKCSPYLPSLYVMEPDSIIIYHVSNYNKQWDLDIMLDKEGKEQHATHLYLDEHLDIYQFSPLNIILPLSCNSQHKKGIGITVKLSCSQMDNNMEKEFKIKQNTILQDIISCLRDTYSIPLANVWQYIY